MLGNKEKETESPPIEDNAFEVKGECGKHQTGTASISVEERINDLCKFVKVRYLTKLFKLSHNKSLEDKASSSQVTWEMQGTQSQGKVGVKRENGVGTALVGPLSPVNQSR